MSDIAGIPYVEAEFDKNGALQNPVNLPPGVTDLFVISHGWNNNAEDARGLYRRLFQNFVAVAAPGDLPGRSFGIVGVIWPSKAFDELVAASGVPGEAQGSASLGKAHDSASLKALEAKLERMKDFFISAAERQTIDEAKALLGDLEDKASARNAFVDKIRSLLNKGAANKEDASTAFFNQAGSDLMDNLKVDEEDLDDDLKGPGGAVALPLGVGTANKVEGGAASLGSILAGFKAAA
ncbi:MAG: hypothetical protein ABI806_24840, partial [Candidatus Solibacter sp.]